MTHVTKTPIKVFLRKILIGRPGLIDPGGSVTGVTASRKFFVLRKCAFARDANCDDKKNKRHGMIFAYFYALHFGLKLANLSLSWPVFT